MGGGAAAEADGMAAWHAHPDPVAAEVAAEMAQVHGFGGSPPDALLSPGHAPPGHAPPGHAPPGHAPADYAAADYAAAGYAAAGYAAAPPTWRGYQRGGRQLGSRGAGRLSASQSSFAYEGSGTGMYGPGAADVYGPGYSADGYYGSEVYSVEGAAQAGLPWALTERNLDFGQTAPAAYRSVATKTLALPAEAQATPGVSFQRGGAALPRGDRQVGGRHTTLRYASEAPR